MVEYKELITVPARVVKELPASLIVIGEHQTRYRRVSTANPQSKKAESLRMSVKDGKKTTQWMNGRGWLEAVPIRVPRSKIIAYGLGTITLPRWVAIQCGLL